MSDVSARRGPRTLESTIFFTRGKKDELGLGFELGDRAGLFVNHVGPQVSLYPS